MRRVLEGDLTIKQYHLYGIPRAGSVVIEYLLEKGGIPYQCSFADQETRNSDAFRKMSPRGQIPILITPDGHIITESLAIIVYLLNEHPEIGLYPKDNPAKGKTLQWLSFLAINLYTANQRYYQTASFHGDPDVIKEGGYHDRRKIYEELEAAADPYLAGQEITAADLYLFMLLNWDRELKDILLSHPKLKQLFKALKACDYVQAVNERQNNAS